MNYTTDNYYQGECREQLDAAHVQMGTTTTNTTTGLVRMVNNTTLVGTTTRQQRDLKASHTNQQINRCWWGQCHILLKLRWGGDYHGEEGYETTE